MIQGLFKKPERRTFNYKARYYDQQNADIRKQKILNGEEDTEVRFEDRFRQKVNENRKVKNNSIRKVVILTTILIILVYLMITL